MEKSFPIRLACPVFLLLLLLAPFSASIASAQPAERVPVIIGFRVLDVELVRSHGGEVKYVYEHVPAIAASIPHQAIEALRKNPRVAYVEPDFEVYALGKGGPPPTQPAETIDWGVKKINAPAVWIPPLSNRGTGIKVAILDTGIDTKHPDLIVAGGVTYVLGTRTYNDDNGHGTHVAGIVAALDNEIGVVGVAPEAALYAVKVLNKQGSGYISDVAIGIAWCITNEMQVISMSFGSTSDSILLSMYCDIAYQNGIVLVAAAGNYGQYGDNTVTYPAKYSSVVAVGATDSDDKVAYFSSRGSELSVTAPGVDIYSTYKGRTYKTMSGTSMACPHVTGTVALVLWKNPALSPAQVRDKLQNTAVKTTGMGGAEWTSAYGYGRIDAYLAVLAS